MRYRSKTRTWRYKTLQLVIPVGVFHPGLYFSTPIFIDWLSGQQWKGKQVLDVGTGSGALGIFLAQQQAQVTVIDINPEAIRAAVENARRMQAPLNAYESDLFAALPQCQFDVVVSNPPYYAKTPQKIEDYAFLAGEQLNWFARFFTEIQPFLRQNTKIWMILSEDCNWNEICKKATGFTPNIVFEQYHWGERLFVAEFVRN